MTDEEMLRALQSVGFAAFVAHFDIFDGPLSNADATARLQERTGWTAAGCRTRVSRARAVLDAGRKADAYDLIARSERTTDAARSRARALLATV